MHWLLIGYMFLFIHRPFEVWPALGDLRIERIYMLFTIGAWFLYPGKRWLSNFQHLAYFGFAFAVLAAWLLSPWMDQGQPVVENWFKIVVFYVLLITCVSDEKALKKLVIGFMLVMTIYLTHSFREYLSGRHTYRMGISRMIGVDSSLGDPNSFGASIVFALPFITCLWRTGFLGRIGQVGLFGYAGLSTLCILLTGSRSSLIGLALWALMLVLTSSRRFLLLTLIAVAAPVGFIVLPQSLQTRFETIVNPEVGPANAKESGEGRVLGLLTGLELWSNNPISGVGPGAWRPATRSNIESHNLFGQLVGETGTIGLLGFLAILSGFLFNWLWVRKVRNAYHEWEDDFLFHLSSAIGTAVILLLFMGLFGHNLFRFSWLWYGGFLIIARYCLEVRIKQDPEPMDEEEDYDQEYEEEPLPEGWTAHPGHVLSGQ
jgi:hypothetical protein